MEAPLISAPLGIGRAELDRRFRDEAIPELEHVLCHHRHDPGHVPDSVASTTPAAPSPPLLDFAPLLDVAVSRLFLLFGATGLYPIPQNAPCVSAGMNVPTSL